MNSFCHYIYSNTLYNMLTKSSVKINKSDFCFGSVRPDFSLRLINIPHTIYGSMDFIKTVVVDLCNLKVKSEKIYSDKLGILIHYLCDYFCYAHNHKKYDKIIPHVVYEMKINLLLMRNKKELLKENCKIKNVVNSIKNSSDIINFILSFHKKYSTSNKSCRNDILYSYFACRVCLDSIIKIAALERLPKAA